jgi:hypothetical protein
LAQVLWALIFVKEHLLEHLGDCGLVDSAMDLYQQQEFVRLINHFFDRAVCYTGEGYEREAHASEPARGLRKRARVGEPAVPTKKLSNAASLPKTCGQVGQLRIKTGARV